MAFDSVANKKNKESNERQRKAAWSRICGCGIRFFHNGNTFIRTASRRRAEEKKRVVARQTGDGFSPFFGFILLIPFTRFGRFLNFTSFWFSSSHFTWPLMHTSRRVSGKVGKSLKFSTNFHIFHLTTINYHVNLMKFSSCLRVSSRLFQRLAVHRVETLKFWPSANL